MNSFNTTSPIVRSAANDKTQPYIYQNPYSFCQEPIPTYNDCANYQNIKQFMKSPLIVYNHCHVKGVLQNAFFMRQELEMQAIAFKLITGVYIRPILLFVLKNQTPDCESELKKIKKEFINSGIPEEQLKIKTNTCDELTGINLYSEHCEIRYVITVHNLTAPWKCSFAYIAASLEERNIPPDLSEILECMLPLPVNITIDNKPLSYGYMVTATSGFDTATQFLKNKLIKLGYESNKLILHNKMVELLKDMSIWEVLAKENEQVKSIKFGEGKNSFKL